MLRAFSAIFVGFALIAPSAQSAEFEGARQFRVHFRFSRRVGGGGAAFANGNSAQPERHTRDEVVEPNRGREKMTGTSRDA